jgi:two-component system, cell cycle response regulator
MNTIGLPERDPRHPSSKGTTGPSIARALGERHRPSVERLVSDPTHGVQVRVILVGKTGLDAKLRLDESVEVVRVRTPMEAIGELGMPINPGARSVVIVGDDAGSVSTDPEVASDFARGLRVIDPHATILRATLGTDGHASQGPFDGLVAHDIPPATLRELLRALPVEASGDTIAPPPLKPYTPPQAHAMTPPVPHAREAAPPAPIPPSALAGEVGDEDVITTLVHGGDVVAPALAVLRRRYADPALAFVPGGDAPAGPHEAAVSWDTARYGTLRSTLIPAVSLVKAAAWLASWLRLAEQQQALRHAAFTDPLTGAMNRRYFDKFLASAIEAARDDRRSVTILLFDVDDFKTYNDRYGHATGDEILREVVKLLQSVVRPTDRVCRIGGDEFAVIFHEPKGPRESGSRHPQTIHAIADRFQSQIRAHKFPRLSQAPGPLTVSGGLATFPWDGGTAAELVAKADALALESKQHGKNVITIGR